MQQKGTINFPQEEGADGREDRLVVEQICCKAVIDRRKSKSNFEAEVLWIRPSRFSIVQICNNPVHVGIFRRVALFQLLDYM